MPLTENGFERLTYDDILNEQINNAMLLFGNDIDTSDQSTFGKILRLYCLDAASNQELAEQVYLSAFPNTAQGVSLDRLTPFVGISRNAASPAEQIITITGTAGTVVPMGSLVSNGNVVFHTLTDNTIGSGGTVTNVIVECNTAGTIGNVPTGSITTIVNPLVGVSSITHTGTSKLGEDTETDYELRNRFAQAFGGAGSGTLDSIRGAILQVSGVESVLIQENDTDSTVGDLPPHSFLCYVLAPSSAFQAIGQAIFNKKPAGIATAGDETVTVTDLGGGSHSISFSRTEEVQIYVKATIDTNSSYSSSSLQAIQNNIISKLAAYGNGQDVTATSLYGAVYVDGVTDVTSLMISSDGETYSTDTIEIDISQVARAIAANIEVTVNE